MEHQVKPVVGVDVYKSQIGSDDEISTVNFTTKSRACADDLVDWLERGYDFVLDAATSPGEVADGEYLVFVEMNRRSTLPARVVEMVSDLQTLTGLTPDDWRVKIGDEMYPLTVDAIKSRVAISPQDYREEQDKELNEWRDIAGIKAVKMFDSTDPDLLAMQRQAGIK